MTKVGVEPLGLVGDMTSTYGVTSGGKDNDADEGSMMDLSERVRLPWDRCFLGDCCDDH